MHIASMYQTKTRIFRRLDKRDASGNLSVRKMHEAIVVVELVNPVDVLGDVQQDRTLDLQRSTKRGVKYAHVTIRTSSYPRPPIH